jgi:hypothetical protein
LQKLVLCALLAAASLLGADVSGNWKGDASRSDGTWLMDVVMMLKQDNDKLTGTVGPSMDEQVAVSNGKVDGDNVTFDVFTDEGTYKVALVVAGDEIKGSAVRNLDGQEGSPMKLQLKRSN